MKATLQQRSAMWPLVACLTLLNLQELAHSSPATFSDANWSQLSGLPGAGSFVYAADRNKIVFPKDAPILRGAQDFATRAPSSGVGGGRGITHGPCTR